MRSVQLVLLQGTADQLAENWHWVLVAGLLALGAILLVWRVLPPRVERLLYWIDRVLPGDFSALHRPLSRVLVAMASGVILFAGAASVAASLGRDIDAIQETLLDFGQNVGTWSAEHLVKIGIIMFVAYLAMRLVRRAVPKALSQLIKRRADEDADARELEKREQTLENVVTNTINITLAVIVFFIIVTELGINVAPLLAGAGVVGIAIGFGAQSLIRDVIAGTFIILEDQYRVGDVVNIAGIGGLVEDINLRRTVLRDLNFTVHVIPNGEVRVASNLTKEKSRVNIDIEVAYKEDLDQCIAVLNRVGQEMKDDPEWGQHMNEPLKVLRVDRFGESGIAIKVLGETKPIKQWDVMGEYLRRVKRAFDDEGIEIPFPHRTLYWGQGQETLLRTLENRTPDRQTAASGEREGEDNP